MEEKNERDGIYMETRLFEKQYQDFLDKNLYNKYSIDRSVSCKKYDLKLIYNNNIEYIEEKGSTYYHPCLPVELIQDLWNTGENHYGWFFHCKADKMVYLYYEKEEPYILYKINYSLLKDEVYDILKNKIINLKANTSNYGLTITLLIKWEELEYKNIDCGEFDILPFSIPTDTP